MADLIRTGITVVTSPTDVYRQATGKRVTHGGNTDAIALALKRLSLASTCLAGVVFSARITIIAGGAIGLCRDRANAVCIFAGDTGIVCGGGTIRDGARVDLAATCDADKCPVATVIIFVGGAVRVRGAFTRRFFFALYRRNKGAACFATCGFPTDGRPTC